MLEDGSREPRYRPSKGNIERQIDAVLRSASEGDVVVLGFSGHGTEIDRTMYLVPGDGDPADPATLVSLDRIYERLRECAASVKFVVVDACRNDMQRGIRAAGVAAGARALAESLEKKPLPEGVVLLTSCASGEVSWEEERFEHGVFMHYVLEGLGGKADADSDGRLSLNELAKYTARQTKSFVLKEKSVTQRPYLRNEGEADLLDFGLLPVAKGAVPVSLTPSPGPASPGAAVAPVKPGQVTTNSLGMKLVMIPAGEFRMGANEPKAQLRNDGFRIWDYEGFDSTDEAPVHAVAITRPFLMGAHEVTLGQFLTFYHADYKGRLDCESDGRGGGGYNAARSGHQFDPDPRYRPWSWGHPGQTNDHPVVNVSWNDAVAFCRWLSKKEGSRYRLPTEAEWEYACRAGTSSRFWNGDDPESVTAVGNVMDGTAKSQFSWLNDSTTSRDGHALTAPVGRFRANPFGLHDMHGNVFEWCSDLYETYGGAKAVDPRGPVEGTDRIYRGGCWRCDAARCRSSYRGAMASSDRFEWCGFRVVCEVE